MGNRYRKEFRLQVGVGGSSIARWYLKPRLDEVSNGKGEEAPRLMFRSQERIEGTSRGD